MILSAPQIDVPEIEELKKELEAIRARTSTTREDLEWGLTLFESHRALGAFDALLAAAALAREAEALVSADRAFGEVTGLRHVDPATPALDELLSS